MRKKEKEDVKKFMDMKMLECINSELQRLEDASDIEEYKIQIRNRRLGLGLIFTDFDFYISLIRKKRIILMRTRENIGKIEILDRILKDKITHKLEQIYKKAVIWGEGSEELFNCKISQIIDRQQGISEILDNYDECINLIDVYQRNNVI